MIRRFCQVDVFGDGGITGNPLAVVLDGDGLDPAAMQAFATWTNLSETTFLLPPTLPEADYRVRIFTATAELPFAGHPTLGSAHAWLDAGGVPRDPGEIVQECGVGLVRLRWDGERLAFAAPPRRRSGPLDEAHLALAEAALGMPRTDWVDHEWGDNGAPWMMVELADAGSVRRAWVDPTQLGRGTAPTTCAVTPTSGWSDGMTPAMPTRCAAWSPTGRTRSPAACTPRLRSGCADAALSPPTTSPPRDRRWAGTARCSSTTTARRSGSADEPSP